MARKRNSTRKQSATLVLFVLCLLPGAGWTQTESVLYNFCAQTNCADGAVPYAGVIFDQKGNLYGTADVVFKLTPKGREKALYTFCSLNNCADGYEPNAVVLDNKGNLYGTTEAGGAYDFNGGTVFKLTPKGKETVLHSFCAQNNCTDGALPYAGVIFDQKGNLYGTTFDGGAYGDGVVFKLTPAGKETVLYSFCAQSDCSDGASPIAGLVFDRKGNLYGTTFGGGAYGEGVVFEVTSKGNERVLYSFCTQNYCTDGKQPGAGLVLDGKGNLYGTTPSGGAYGNGTVFKLTPAGLETVLYSFCAQSHCSDGGQPFAGVIFDHKGNLYGTTFSGGTGRTDGGGGTVFKLTSKGKEKVLYPFCEQTNCPDGADPDAGLVFDQKGNLYGTTEYGGSNNNQACRYLGCGVVFKLTP